MVGKTFPLKILEKLGKGATILKDLWKFGEKHVVPMFLNEAKIIL